MLNSVLVKRLSMDKNAIGLLIVPKLLGKGALWAGKQWLKVPWKTTTSLGGRAKKELGSAIKSKGILGKGLGLLGAGFTASMIPAIVPKVTTAPLWAPYNMYKAKFGRQPIPLI